MIKYWRTFQERRIYRNNGGIMKNYGYCCCCDQNTLFHAQNDWYRDYYICTLCGSIPRERAIMYVIDKLYPNWKELKIHESSPLLGRGASLKISSQSAYYLASQYFPQIKLGEIYNGFRNEDLSTQTFEDESFDIVITQDVLEHVFNAQQVFREIARTLKKGGAHIFTVPLVNKENPTTKAADLDENGDIQYFAEPQYHGNPVDKKGSLVTYHFGFDITDLIYKATDGGLVSTIFHIDNLDMGIRAEYIEVVVSRKL